MRFNYVPNRPKELTLSERLELVDKDDDGARAALRGERLPRNLGNPYARCCIVRGIRYHIAFARSDEVNELISLPGQEAFARARNAALTMNNVAVPNEFMSNKDWHPYCIWYPKAASEETYRALAQQYPDMRYQVGRACAVAGYLHLYRELNLLPDVSIAEEARERRENPGSQEIYADIMAAPVRYRVMDDYTLTIHLDNPTSPTYLNADTAVVASLTAKGQGIRRRDFNITEDWGVSVKTVTLPPPLLTCKEIALLKNPLPPDLPTMNKTLLILHAAATGNVTRYVRLRRPWPVDGEPICLVRGCYHSTALATWLSTSPGLIPSLHLDEPELKLLRRAINARLIMDGVKLTSLLDLSTTPDDELPYWIWYPVFPSPSTLTTLASARPAMRPQCLRASIACNFPDAFDHILSLDPSLAPDFYTMTEAQHNANPYYLEILQQRKQDLGIEHLESGTEWKHILPYGPYYEAEPPLQSSDEFFTDSKWQLVDGFGQPGEVVGDGFYEGWRVTLREVARVLGMGEEEREAWVGRGWERWEKQRSAKSKK